LLARISDRLCRLYCILPFLGRALLGL
jgi:hypothetical protein